MMEKLGEGRTSTQELRSWHQPHSGFRPQSSQVFEALQFGHADAFAKYHRAHSRGAAGALPFEEASTHDVISVTCNREVGGTYRITDQLLTGCSYQAK
jgi:hypothetical protein